MEGQTGPGGEGAAEMGPVCGAEAAVKGKERWVGVGVGGGVERERKR